MCRAPSYRRDVRAGFTLVEALVALVLFEIGIMALVASGAVAARDLAAANRRTRARSAASEHVERLRVSACAASAHGRADIAGGLAESWRVEAAGPTRVITDSIEYLLPGAHRSRVVVRAFVMCAQ